MPGIDGRITTHDGLELAYRLYGHGVGRPIVLLHGGGANLVSMDQWAERLDANRTVVSLDLRACGQSGECSRATPEHSPDRPREQTAVGPCGPIAAAPVALG